MSKTYQPDYAVHPGESLLEKLEEMQMTPKEFSVRTGKPVKTVSNIINGKSAITPEMAVQFEKVLNIPAKFWISKQASYNEFVAKEKYQEDLAQAEEWAKQFPYAQMAKMGIVKPTRNITEKTAELLDFFDVAKHTAWENIYFNQKTPIYFRISLKHSKNPYALSVLLQVGKLKAKKMQAPPFDKTALKKLLPELKTIMADRPLNFLVLLQEKCLSVGLKVIYTQNLKGTVTNAVVRWIDDHPVIQMTDRQKKYDIFWFSFFHELGHVILHGSKKNIFLDEAHADKKNKQEIEADDFARQWILPDEAYEEALVHLKTEDNLLAVAEYYAEKHGTHRDMILGRFLFEQKDQKYRYLYGKIKKVNFSLWV